MICGSEDIPLLGRNICVQKIVVTIERDRNSSELDSLKLLLFIRYSNEIGVNSVFCFGRGD